MLKYHINFNCHILLSQAISSRFLPLHSLGNIRIVYCSSDSIELGKSKQDVALCNYRSQGMMEEQTEAEVTRNSHFCFSPHGCPLFQTLVILCSACFLYYHQAYTVSLSMSGHPPSCVAYSTTYSTQLVTIVSPHWGHAPTLQIHRNYSCAQLICKSNYERNILPAHLHFFIELKHDQNFYGYD